MHQLMACLIIVFARRSSSRYWLNSSIDAYQRHHTLRFCCTVDTKRIIKISNIYVCKMVIYLVIPDMFCPLATPLVNDSATLLDLTNAFKTLTAQSITNIMTHYMFFSLYKKYESSFATSIIKIFSFISWTSIP